MAIAPEAFFLDPHFGGNLQQQIQHMVAGGILAGRFRPGDKLPSSRKLARHLGVSRITVALAFAELVSDDYLVSKDRSGYFVSQSAPRRATFSTAAQAPVSSIDWGRAIGQRYSNQVLPEKPSDWQAYPYRFIYGQADDALFDHHGWRLCALQALGRKEFSSVTADYYERDDESLVKFIALYTLPRRGILARPEEILVTLGAQNALWLCAQVLLNQRRTAVMENPGYPGLRAILEQTRCNLVQGPVDGDGLIVDALPGRADAIFVTPSHHCPTNVTMPVERRQALLAHAARNDSIVVEDDYEFEISFAKPPAPALKSLDREGRVIYVGSFSKSLFPGLRLGFIVASEPFIREARALRATVLRHPPGQIQRTVANFLSLGHHDALVARLSQAYARRRAIMRKAIAESGLELAQEGSAGGSSLWMRAPQGCDTVELARRLRPLGVLIEPGHVFFDRRDAPRHFYRLAYSSIEADKIEEGIRLIAGQLRAQLASSGQGHWP
ncbi:MAG: PLP-dependent aminotransferase family protein [Nitratireductor sp.]|nr:PLP-dependent aminotransferase family protein [Nitratireductor sp.]